jgi:hypothetical protein
MTDRQKAARVCLRAASVVSAVFAGGHTYGTLAILNGPGHDQLRQQMVLVEGIAKTYADLFAGYGYMVTTLLLMQAVVLWMAAAAHEKGFSVAGPVVWIALISSGNAVLSHLFLIPIPLAFLSVIVMLLLTHLLLMRGQN